MPQKLDIHHFEAQLIRQEEKLRESSLSAKNKALISSFVRDTSISDNPAVATKVKYYEVLRVLAKKYLNGAEFESMTFDDLKELKYSLDTNPKLKPWTRQKYGVLIKKFFKWMGKGELVKWWNASLKARDKAARVQASDLLTEEEIQKVINAADSKRDKAFLCLLYELGARISEIGNMRISDVTKVKHGCVCDLSGKTGHRTPIIVMSVPYLLDSIDSHPTKNKPDSPLWVYRDYLETNTPENKKLPHKDRKKTPVYRQLSYSGLKEVVKDTARKAGITKRIYPHLFRHSRATHLLAKGLITESQAKCYFGWVPGSSILATYSHLVIGDANDAILQAEGIIQKESAQDKLKPRICPACSAINTFDAQFCRNCHAILDLKTAMEIDEKYRLYEKFVDVLAREINTEVEKDPVFRDMIISRVFKKPLVDEMIRRMKG